MAYQRLVFQEQCVMQKFTWKRLAALVAILAVVGILSACGDETADPGLDGGAQVDGGGGGDSGLVVDCSDNPQYCMTSADCAAVGCKCYCQDCGDGFSSEDVVNAHCVDSWYADRQCLPPVGCPGVCCPQRVMLCEDHICKVTDGKI